MTLRKKRAKTIFKRINEGEKVVTTVVHLSEVANILEDAENLAFALRFVISMLRKDTIQMEAVTAEDYLLAASLAREKKISVNDAVAVIKMDRLGINEIYSFDAHFDHTSKQRIKT